MMLFFKGITRELHGYPTLRSTELAAGKRQQLLLQCCISPGTDEQEHCIRFAMLFFLCWQHHNCVPGSPKGLLGAASAAQKNNIKVTFFFFLPFLFIEKQFICVKRARREGTRTHCQPLFTPTYLPSFRVYSLKNRHKNNLRSGKDEIRHHDARKDLPTQAQIDAKDSW